MPQMQDALIRGVGRLMDERGWTQLVLADKSGLGTATVGRIMRGIGNARLDIVEKLRAAFDVQPAELFSPTISAAATRARDVKTLADLQQITTTLNASARLMASETQDALDRLAKIRHETPGDKPLAQLDQATLDHVFSAFSTMLAREREKR